MASRNELTDFELDRVSGGGGNMGVEPPAGDIAEMCFVVLACATNDQDKDLQSIMGGGHHGITVIPASVADSEFSAVLTNR